MFQRCRFVSSARFRSAFADPRIIEKIPFRPSRDLPDSLLKPIHGLRRNNALDLRTSRKAESKKLPLLRSCHRTLRLIYLELELLRDELRDALHHPLPRPLAANIDITVSRPGESHPEPLSEPYLNLSA